MWSLVNYERIFSDFLLNEFLSYLLNYFWKATFLKDDTMLSNPAKLWGIPLFYCFGPKTTKIAFLLVFIGLFWRK